MTAFEPLTAGLAPDVVAVVGDVNSTLACAPVSVLVAHVEAALRSRDRCMPEQISRLITRITCAPPQRRYVAFRIQMNTIKDKTVGSEQIPHMQPGWTGIMPSSIVEDHEQFEERFHSLGWSASASFSGRHAGIRSLAMASVSPSTSARIAH